MNTKNNYLRGALAALVLIVVAGCSGESEPSGAAATTATAPSAAPAVAEAKAPVENPPATPSDDSSISADMVAQLEALGAGGALGKVAQLYIPDFPAGFLDAVNVKKDIAYGPAERNILDVMSPKSMPTGRPVVIFVHGGGFGSGNKSNSTTPYYDNIPYWAATHNLVGVNINYRYAPASQWPSGIEDLDMVMAWVKDNIAQYGGDPDKIFMWGKSTGASHVADYVADKVKKMAPLGISGVIFTSGSFALGDTPLWANYYGDDVSKYPEMNALPSVVKADVPILATYGEYDGDQYKVQFKMLKDAMADAGKPLETLFLKHHSHLSETYAVGTTDESLSGPVLDFVLRNSGEK